MANKPKPKPLDIDDPDYLKEDEYRGEDENPVSIHQPDVVKVEDEIVPDKK